MLIPIIFSGKSDTIYGFCVDLNWAHAHPCSLLLHLRTIGTQMRKKMDLLTRHHWISAGTENLLRLPVWPEQPLPSDYWDLNVSIIWMIGRCGLRTIYLKLTLFHSTTYLSCNFFFFLHNGVKFLTAACILFVTQLHLYWFCALHQRCWFRT